MSQRAINYKHLRYFWSVVRLGGVQKAAEDLHVSAQTVSSQLQLLEEGIDVELFDRSGRNLKLTEQGQMVFGYAEEIFALGDELRETLHWAKTGAQILNFKVGVADAVPKAIAYHLLEPALQLPQAVKFSCREWKLEKLFTELNLFRLDLVLSDAPLPRAVGARAFSHELGASAISFYASTNIAAGLTRHFPNQLDGEPILLPAEESALRGRLERWFRRHGIRPLVRGEFDDSALAQAFAEAGVGIFVCPSILDEQLLAQQRLVKIGETSEIQDYFYALTVDRHIKHPCVIEVINNARQRLTQPGKK